ncbi:MAG: type II toxin-antitoxin system VapC family toxin [Acidobacteriota bacterium]
MAKTEIAFWDTSAVLPLCCRQTSSPEARRANRRFRSSVVWWGTRVEIHSGVARLRRLTELNDRGVLGAIRKWDVFEREAAVIRPVEHVLDVAATLPGRFGLRSQDAFQLAAALVWCREKPRNRAFICADHRLGEAASDAGFSVISLQ